MCVQGSEQHTNHLSFQLMLKGYTKSDLPPDCSPWSMWWGGWRYKKSVKNQMVFETPCGLLARGNLAFSLVSYMGVWWCAENDNSLIYCPWSQSSNCTQNHFLLRDQMGWCSCHLSKREYHYDHSVEKVRADEAVRQTEERETAYTLFVKQNDGKACKVQSFYDHETGEWRSLPFDPRKCTGQRCDYCGVLGKEVSFSKGNVYYDVRTTTQIKGEGLLPDTERISIVKGKRLLPKKASVTICDAIVQYAQPLIQEDYVNNQPAQRSTIGGTTTALINFRCEVRPTRDLAQDLEDLRCGIEVLHDIDVVNAAAQERRLRREVAKKKRLARLEQRIREHGFGCLDYGDQQRAIKYLGKERIQELIEAYEKHQCLPLYVQESLLPASVDKPRRQQL